MKYRIRYIQAETVSTYYATIEAFDEDNARTLFETGLYEKEFPTTKEYEDDTVTTQIDSLVRIEAITKVEKKEDSLMKEILEILTERYGAKNISWRNKKIILNDGKRKYTVSMDDDCH